MRTKSWVALGLWGMLVASAVAQQDRAHPYLVFDAGGHTAAVNDVCFTPDGWQIVTVSNDKTIRFWDVRSGEPVDVLRPPVGPGTAGMLYAADISRDGRWLAIGGFGALGSDHGIYLIDLRDRKIAAVLRGHTNVILDLAFSSDGRLLASAGADKTARLWDVAARRQRATLRGHREGVSGLAFSPENRYLATVSLDKTGHIWSVQTAEKTASLSGHVAGLQTVAWSANGELLATGCVDQSINIWSPEGQLLRRFQQLGNNVTGLRFAADSRQLFYTLGGAEATDGGFLMDLANHRRRVAFTGHDNSVLAGDVSPDGALAATADASGVICLWQTKDGRLLHRLASAGRRPWGVAWDRRSGAIAWGNTSRYVTPNDRGPLERAFQLRELLFVPLPAVDAQAARSQAGPVTLQALNDDTLVARQPAGGQTRLKLDNPYDVVRCFTLLDDRTAAIGSDFGLFLFDTRTGRRTRQLAGHVGAVWAVAPSPDGRYLLSAADDRTLRVWSWQQGRLLLSTFFAGRQWIAWTPEGYYAASAGGERLMGWLINNGPGRLGTFYPAVQFRSSLYRPELLRRLLDAGSVEQALSEAEPARPRAAEATRVEHVLPPMVRITQPAQSPLQVGRPQLQVRATARRRSQHQVTALRLLLDGRPYEGRKGIQVLPLEPESDEEIAAEWTVELTAGRHRLAVQAETRVSKGVSETVEVEYHEPAAPKTPRLPDLYVLAIGVSDYSGPLRLEYAANDAQRVVEGLQEVTSHLFRNVHVRLRTDEQATRREILAGLTWLRREMTQRDVTLFFFSGHGAKDEAGNFYLVPIDGDPADLLATAVLGSQFKDALAGIPGRVLVLLDACHAGAAGGDRRKAVYVLTDDLIRDLATDDYGVVVMCSSMGREYSMESDEHKQGYFTVALLEALKGKADYNGDGLVYLTEMDTYVSDRVKQLTQGQQHPVTAKPTTIRSFPLAKP